MLGSITPLGERSRRSRWGLTVAAYVAGSVLGGAATGAIAGSLGRAAAAVLHLGPGQVLMALGMVALGAATLDVARTGEPAPGLRRQVNDAWMYEYRGWVYGLAFGAQLGAGVATVVSTAAVYAAFAAAVLSGSIRGGMLVGLAFAVARAVPLLTVGWVRTPSQLVRVNELLARWARPARRAAEAGVLGLGLAAAALAVR